MHDRFGLIAKSVMHMKGILLSVKVKFSLHDYQIRSTLADLDSSNEESDKTNTVRMLIFCSM
jgi:hypothetical protein